VIFAKFAIYSTLSLTQPGLALSYIPYLWINRTTIALVGAAVLIALGVLNLQEAWYSIDANIIVFLYCIFVKHDGD
jgi:Na+/H+ antiporter NhaD/arsenite permease-like protein